MATDFDAWLPLWKGYQDFYRVSIDDAVILIRIPALYRPGMSDTELYEATRAAWVIGPRRDCADYAFAVVSGVGGVVCGRGLGGRAGRRCRRRGARAGTARRQPDEGQCAHRRHDEADPPTARTDPGVDHSCS